MKILYRISDGSYKKERFPHATKKGCLDNFLKHFPKEEVTIYADNVKDETYQWLQEYECEILRTNGGSSAAGFRIVMEAALQLPDNESVYFVEDDYFHLPNSRTVLLEGLERSHYISLYDHRDKYIPASMGGNPFIEDDAAELTKVFVTNSVHWKLTNSTTMTFATKVITLKEDAEIWKKYTSGTYPQDFKCFLELRENGRTLATPIPGYSTHCEPMWASPLIDWESCVPA
jgi:hypothetical protein